ncbi:hypothetical protein ATANTOWER_015821 [Ataeniobius toweri]|uniref:Uncharacterized protein n=1 Tax=Ataeniobius toweri TaxID=208326 RepID=A0ABU7A6K4_9TELE|nr:hypothetical protein [Ataeniobius toweri]
MLSDTFSTDFLLLMPALGVPKSIRSAEMAEKRKVSDIRSFFSSPKRQAKSSQLCTESEGESDRGVESQQIDYSESRKVKVPDRDPETSNDSRGREAAGDEYPTVAAEGTGEEDRAGHDDLTASTSTNGREGDTACFSSDLFDCTKPYQPHS